MTQKNYMESPVGTLEIIENEGAVVGIGYVHEESAEHTDVLNPVINQCVKELQEYFDGERTVFNVPTDLEFKGTEFQQKVWQRLKEIPYGETISYKTLALDCGGPNYSRAAANANGKNPISIIVPCHRVIAHDGGIGGYTGGVDKKRRLLEVESD
ncbi:methylated-DNA--[protein]-cysteine S-methyltransferase [Salinicoccus albus]|uniref:methylated-DNA--[protein]-cysteine S-methyltransferase n=1 Tax=Salinicoccus albus TaxID=418756 RepID=UPI000380ED14|nr:methylated-DNA--[protein]-cysteine S-methyltransferase [Salinicoccus albus]